MKSYPALRHGLLALSLGLAALSASADDDCDAPLERWQTREAVRQMAAANGWQIQRLKIDDGCYEIRGKDAQGRSFKAKIDPETLKVLKIKQDDRSRVRETDRSDPKADRGPDHETTGPARAPHPEGAASPPVLLTPDAPPSGPRQ